MASEQHISAQQNPRLSTLTGFAGLQAGGHPCVAHPRWERHLCECGWPVPAILLWCQPTAPVFPAKVSSTWPTRGTQVVPSWQNSTTHSVPLSVCNTMTSCVLTAKYGSIDHMVKTDSTARAWAVAVGKVRLCICCAFKLEHAGLTQQHVAYQLSHCAPPSTLNPLMRVCTFSPQPAPLCLQHSVLLHACKQPGIDTFMLYSPRYFPAHLSCTWLATLRPFAPGLHAALMLPPHQFVIG